MALKLARGLEGIVSHETRLSDVDGERGRLIIGGYDVGELAGRMAFEDVAYLLWNGDLPNPTQAAAIREELAAARQLPGPVLELIRRASPHATGMHALRVGAAVLSLGQESVEVIDL